MKPNQMLKSLLASLGVVVVGIPIVYVLLDLPFTWLLSALAGYGAGTLINRAGGRNGGPVAIIISIVATAIPFLVWLNVAAILAGGGAAALLRLVPMVFAVIAAGLANRRL